MSTLAEKEDADYIVDGGVTLCTGTTIANGLARPGFNDNNRSVRQLGRPSIHQIRTRSYPPTDPKIVPFIAKLWRVVDATGQRALCGSSDFIFLVDTNDRSSLTITHQLIQSAKPVRLQVSKWSL